MRASYTAGVVTSLIEAGIFFDWVGGVSAGASSTVNYLSRDTERARRSFVDLAADPLFGDWRTFAQGRGYFSAHYIYEQAGLPGGSIPYDFDTFQANPAQLRINSFTADTGETVAWSKADCPSLTALMRRVRASSTMPILMPFPEIDGRHYADGALGTSGGVILDQAIADGFDRFFVVLTRPRGYRKRPTRYPGFYRRILRRYPAVADATITRWQRYNATMDQLEKLERRGKAYLFYPEHMAVTTSEKNVTKLQTNYEAGYAQAQRELPTWHRFLGLT